MNIMVHWVYLGTRYVHPATRQILCNIVVCNWQYLTLFVPAYFDVSIYLGWGGLGFQFFLEITCLGVIYHIQKDS